MVQVIPIANPDISSIEISYVNNALNLGDISGIGKYVRVLEEKLCLKTGRQYCIATSSGTVALFILMKALGIGPGDEVIVPNFTFVAPASAAKLLGAKVILADIELEFWTIDPAEVKALITDKTKLVVGVDILGHHCRWHELVDICKQRNITIIQDSAQAHGNFYRDGEEYFSAGSLGVASVFSFFANKTITSGEGGCILTDDKNLADECRLLVNHGMANRGSYSHSRVGFNGRIGNLQAAIGTAQVTRWHELIESKINTRKTYERLLSGLPGLIPSYNNIQDTERYVPYLYCLFVDSRYSGITALGLHQRLRRLGIDSRLTWNPLSWNPQGKFYADPNKDYESSKTCHISSNTISLPTHQKMSLSHIEFICESIKMSLPRKI